MGLDSRYGAGIFPMAAMAATQAGQPELALEFLLLDSPMNRYLVNGCNFQRAGDNAIPAYFPGNGGLLAAIAMMAGGWDGSPTASAPGFPKNGKWNVRAEGFRRLDVTEIALHRNVAGATGLRTRRPVPHVRFLTIASVAGMPICKPL